MLRNLGTGRPLFVTLTRKIRKATAGNRTLIVLRCTVLPRALLYSVSLMKYRAISDHYIPFRPYKSRTERVFPDGYMFFLFIFKNRCSDSGMFIA